MKRIIAFLLLTCMLLLAACDGNPPAGTSGGESTPETGSESVEESSEVTEEGFRKTLISVGKSYTYGSTTPSPYYPDLFDQQLTDGQKAFDTGVHYTDVRMVGYTDDLVVIVDLGEDGKRISGASARGIDMNKDGVKLPDRLRISGSDDGRKWTSLGKAEFEATGDMTVSTATVELTRRLYLFISF